MKPTTTQPSFFKKKQRIENLHYLLGCIRVFLFVSNQKVNCRSDRGSLFCARFVDSFFPLCLTNNTQQSVHTQKAYTHSRLTTWHICTRTSIGTGRRCSNDFLLWLSAPECLPCSIQQRQAPSMSTGRQRQYDTRHHVHFTLFFDGPRKGTFGLPLRACIFSFFFFPPSPLPFRRAAHRGSDAFANDAAWPSFCFFGERGIMPGPFSSPGL